MASRNTYPCYICIKNGFADVRVYLDGKTADGKTIYKNEDMSPHIHKQHAPEFRQRVNSNTSSMQESQPQQPAQEQQQPTELSLKLIHARIDRVVQLLESQNHIFALLLDPQQREKLKQYEDHYNPHTLLDTG
jgi:hypothetical protein